MLLYILQHAILTWLRVLHCSMQPLSGDFYQTQCDLQDLLNCSRGPERFLAEREVSDACRDAADETDAAIGLRVHRVQNAVAVADEQAHLFVERWITSFTNEVLWKMASSGSTASALNEADFVCQRSPLEKNLMLPALLR